MGCGNSLTRTDPIVKQARNPRDRNHCPVKSPGMRELLKVVPANHVKTLTKGRLWNIQDFDRLTQVGSGTFSTIRLVKIKGSNDRTPMALKILKKADVIKLKQVVHTMNERTILSMISHPFIVMLLTTFQDERRLYILLEYVNGGDLFSLLRSEGRLPNDHARFYAAELTLAFSYMHELHICHRDLKPENIMLDGDGHVKLTDFGFAKIIKHDTFTLCGTPEYLAPEVIQAQGHGRGVDWWAFGVLLFEMTAGVPPFSGSSAYETYQKVLAGKVEFPRHFDVKMQDLITSLLKEDVKERIGCHWRKGAEDVKKHKWYKGVDWDLVLNRSVHPPFIPPVRSADDTSMYDAFPESDGELPPRVRPKDQILFDGFSSEIN